MKHRVKLEILSNVRCRASGVAKDVLAFLDEALAETQKGSEWAPNHRRFGGRWDGKRHHFYCSPTTNGVGTFPKGLLPRVLKLLQQKKIKSRIVDLRERILPPVDLSKITPSMLHGVSMTGRYSFQFDAVNAALKAQAGILFMATNAGKTEISTAMIRALDKHSILFVVPKAILLKETRERIAERLGTIVENIGVIGGGRFDPKDITIAIINSITPAKSARSIRSKKKNDILRAYLKTVDVVFLDEGHHAKAATWFRLMNALPNAQFRYLMSGTPFTGDNDLMIEAATGPVIYEIRNDALIAAGVSAKPKIRVLQIAEPDLDQEDDQTWHGIYSAGIVNNEYRNGVISKIADEYATAGKAVLVLIRHLSQGSHIMAQLQAPAEFVHGKLPADVRDRSVDWFKNKEGGRVLVASSIFDEGVNVPHVNAMIVADGGESLRAVLQKVGRSIRRKQKGDNVVDVVDFADCTHRWLATHALERFEIYAGEGFEIVEEDSPSSEKEEDAKTRRSGSEEDSTPTLSTLSRQAAGGSELPRSGVDGFRTARSSAIEGSGELPEGCNFVRWRWSQAS